MIVFDANIWIAKFDPNIRKPVDSSTGEEVLFAQERVESLIKQAGQNKQTILIPTPVLTEVLAYTDDRRYEMLSILERSAHLKVAPFDMKAAIELAEMNLEAAKSEKVFSTEAPYQKQKLDRQIIAIAKVHDGASLYTTDRSLGNFAARFDLDVKHLSDIPIPEDAKQLKLLD